MISLNELKQKARDYGLKIGGRKAEVEARVMNALGKAVSNEYARMRMLKGYNYKITQADSNVITERAVVELKRRAYNKKNKIPSVEMDWVARAVNSRLADNRMKPQIRNNFNSTMTQLQTNTPIAPAIEYIPQLKLTKVVPPFYKQYTTIVSVDNHL